MNASLYMYIHDYLTKYTVITLLQALYKYKYQHRSFDWSISEYSIQNILSIMRAIVSYIVLFVYVCVSLKDELLLQFS